MFVPTLKFIRWKIPAPIEAPIEYIWENVEALREYLDRGFYFEFSGLDDAELEVFSECSDATLDQLKGLAWYASYTGLPIWLCGSGFLCHALMRIGDDVPVDIGQLKDIAKKLPDDDDGPFALIPVDQGFFTIEQVSIAPH